MKTKIIKIALLLAMSVLFLGIQSKAQSAKEIVKLQDKAYRAYLNKNYDKASRLLIQLDTISVDANAVYDYWIGMCLLSTDNKVSAIPYLEKAKQVGKTSFVVDYYLGRAYLYAGKFEEAKQHLIAYANEFSARGIRFRKELVKSESHRIHVQKSLDDVYGFIAQCDTGLERPDLSDAR